MCLLGRMKDDGRVPGVTLDIKIFCAVCVVVVVVVVGPRRT